MTSHLDADVYGWICKLCGAVLLTSEEANAHRPCPIKTQLAALCDPAREVPPDIEEALEWAIEYCLPPRMENEVWLRRGVVFKAILAAVSPPPHC